jgi:hypothetical protein
MLAPVATDQIEGRRFGTDREIHGVRGAGREQRTEYGGGLA